MAERKTGGMSRRTQGEETRATLIAVASRLFAQRGYDGVSMRTLAAEAGVNLATVGYHFGGKPGLYQAIMERFIDARDEIFPRASDVRARLDRAGDDVRAKGEVADWFVGKIVPELLGHGEYTWAAFIISRELARPSQWYPMLEKDFFTPLFDTLCTLVAGVTGMTDRTEVMITAHCHIGIVTKLLEAHALINRRLGWANFEDNLGTLVPIVKKRIRGLLGLPMEEA